jgi:DHA2 family multidrug resistance protein-like MFS transporter
MLAGCCAVAFARLVDPRLWMMGLDIPDVAFGAGWHDYRVFSTVAVLLLLAGMIAGGLLGDVVGRRRVLLGGSLVSSVFGVLTIFAPNVPWFAVTRTVDAVAGAIAFPLTLAVLRLTFSGRERDLAILVYTVVTGAALLAALLAIVLEQRLGWRATLVLPAVVGSCGTFLVWRFVPESCAPEGARRPAATAAAWAMILLPLTLSAIAARLAGSWRNPVAGAGLGLAAGGLLLLGLAWRGRVRAEAAGLIERRRHQLSVMLLAGATLSFGLTGYALQLYGFFTVVRGYGAITGGLALLPMLAVILVTVRQSAQLTLRSDARRLIAGGLVLMGVASGATALVLPSLPPYWLLVVPLGLFGYGCLVAQWAWTTSFLSAMPEAVVGTSAGIMRATGSTGAVLGGAMLGTVLLFAGRAAFALRLDALGLSPGQAALAQGALDALLLADAASDRTLPPPSLVAQGLLALYRDAYTAGVAAALSLAAVACLAMAALAWLVLEPRPSAGSVAQDGMLETPI